MSSGAGASAPSGSGSRGAPTLRAVGTYFLGLGTVGFGGPVVLVERMRRDFHEVRGWCTTGEFKEGLALAQLAPGPLAAQLAIYLGWVRGGIVGAAVSGAGFVLPSFLMVLAISAAYVRFGGLPWMQGAFYGVGAAVIAVIASSAWRLARKTVGSDWLLWGVVAVNAVVTAWTEAEVLSLFVASGLVVVVVRAIPRVPPAAAAAIMIPAWLVTGLHGAASWPTLLRLAGFFAKAGTVVFGSGLAIVPFLHGGVVQQTHWLTERQFLDAVAVSMITPGPVVITVVFIGYLVAGPLGACAAALGVFLPTYLAVVLVARWFHRVAQSPQLRAAVDGVTAAATGAIIGAAIVLGRRALVDATAVLLFLAALGIVLRAKQVPEPVLMLAAGLAGMGLRGPAA
ncbi:MAG TPA: chromate efflux transporter [Gemmatimonadaceae bacterium]|nr:chromate efflux transporter [Gemmatimonadaceae bacterium]